MPGVAAVTGATGFIGTHLVRYLAERGWKIRILARRIPGGHDFPLPPVETVIGDLDDPVALRRLVEDADVIIHLAGLVKAPSAEAFHRTNVQGTAAVAAAVAALPKARLIYVSSLAAREPDLSDYAQSKALAEDEVRKIAPGLNSIIIRPSVVYGPGDRETFAFFQSANRGFSIIPGALSQRISFIHINSLLSLIHVICDNESAVSASLEVDDGHPGGYGWPEIVSAMSSAAGQRLRTVHLPAAAVRMAAGINAAMHRLRGTATMFTPGKAQELLHTDWAVRTSAADWPPGWRPNCGLVEGFEKTMLWYRSKGWL
jgi:2-alkyl-3-oxoalkanoate reductase